MNGISIILCCHNSAARLPDTLKHLANQILPENVPVELILVNNSSTDDTASIAETLWASYSSPPKLLTSYTPILRVIEEPRPGVLYARQRGVEAAHYELIVFCDDDNWLAKDYLLNAWNRMIENPRIGAIGGKGIAVGEIELPYWFEANKTGFACGEQWPKTGICTDRMYLWGAGLVTRKSILTKVLNPQYPMLLTGHKEGFAQAGDDMEICKRIILLGYDLYYDSSLVYQHFIPANRLTPEYLRSQNQGVLQAIPIQRFYSYFITKQKVLSALLPFVVIWHTYLYLLLKLGFPVGKRKPIINFFKVYSEGIRKKGRYHKEHNQIKAFVHQAQITKTRLSTDDTDFTDYLQSHL